MLQYNKTGVIFGPQIKRMEILTMSGNTRGVMEVDKEFYENYEDANIRMAQADHNLVFYTEGLAVLEKQLMVRSDNDYYKAFNKRLPEYLQRREAKSHPDYVTMVRSKASAQRDKTIYKGRIEILKMQFEEWRTRSADRRNSI
jgi:hypothetical protein